MQDNAERARDLLAARREHSKGQGNFPTPEPHMGMRDERPEDREPGGMELVEGSLERPQREARPARPNARRSSAAKREVMRDERPRRRGRVEPGTATKDTEKNDKRCAGESRDAVHRAGREEGESPDVRRARPRGAALGRYFGELFPRCPVAPDCAPAPPALPRFFPDCPPWRSCGGGIRPVEFGALRSFWVGIAPS